MQQNDLEAMGIHLPAREPPRAVVRLELQQELDRIRAELHAREARPWRRRPWRLDELRRLAGTLSGALDQLEVR